MVVRFEADLEAHVQRSAGNVTRRVVIVVGRGEGPLDRVVKLCVPRCRREGAMRCLLVVQQAEGSAAGPRQEVQRHVGRDVSCVALVAEPLATDDEVGVEVDPLARQDLPFVKTLGLVPQVPLPKEPGPVAVLLQQLGECRDGGIDALDRSGAPRITKNPVDVGVRAGENSRPAGSAQRVCAEGVREADTLASKAVDAGCPEQTVAGAAHLLRRLVVGHDDDHVRSGRRSADTATIQECGCARNPARLKQVSAIHCAGLHPKGSSEIVGWVGTRFRRGDVFGAHSITINAHRRDRVEVH